MSDTNFVIKKKRGDDGYKTFSIRIRDSVASKIDDLAKTSGRSRNELIGMMLEYAVEKSIIE